MPFSEEEPGFFDERFATLRVVQEALERRGYYFHAVEKEHAEGLVTGPLLHRLHTTIKKRSFSNVAAKVAITFSGFAHDEREVYDIPEIRAYWREMDAQLPELPALLAIIPELRYNGPGMQLSMLGEVDVVAHHPDEGRYALHVVDGPRLIADAMVRIQQAGRKYHLTDGAIQTQVEQFRRSTGAE